MESGIKWANSLARSIRSEIRLKSLHEDNPKDLSEREGRWKAYGNRGLWGSCFLTLFSEDQFGAGCDRGLFLLEINTSLAEYYMGSHIILLMISVQIHLVDTIWPKSYPPMNFTFWANCRMDKPTMSQHEQTCFLACIVGEREESTACR